MTDEYTPPDDDPDEGADGESDGDSPPSFDEIPDELKAPDGPEHLHDDDDEDEDEWVEEEEWVDDEDEEWVEEDEEDEWVEEEEHWEEDEEWVEGEEEEWVDDEDEEWVDDEDEEWVEEDEEYWHEDEYEYEDEYEGEYEDEYEYEDSGSLNIDEVDLDRRTLLLGGGGALAALLGTGTAGWFAGSWSAGRRLAEEQRQLEEEREALERELEQEKARLEREHTVPTTEDTLVHETEDSLIVMPRNYRHIYLEFERETLLTYTVDASDRLDIFLMGPDGFADYRNREDFEYKELFSEVDTSVTQTHRVIDPGWYVLVLDNTEDHGRATPPEDNRGRIMADVTVKAYQTPPSDSDEAEE